MKYKFSIFLIFSSFCLSAQNFSWSPQFPTINDTLTILYNSSLGNGSLQNVSEIYAHTGVINRFSSSENDWQNIPVEWHEGPDSIIKMNSLGSHLFEMKFRIKSFYGLNNSDETRYLNFVFRDDFGNLSGLDSNNMEFNIPIFQDNEIIRFTKPLEYPLIKNIGDNVNIEIISKQTGMINLFRNGLLISQNYGSSLSSSFTTQNYGKNILHFEFQSNGLTHIDTLEYIVDSNQVILDPPSNVVNGINYMSDSSVILMLEAPYKEFVYVIGSFNDWKLDPRYKMHKNNNGDKYWIEIDNLTPNQEYLFQYYVDAEIKIADPYSRKILSVYDKYIPNSIYPNLINYPENKTNHAVSVIETNKLEYNWSTNNFMRPDQRDLVIYELLIRDFSYRSDYQTVIDSLPHLKKLGINAIELMPIIEFDGLSSWGYAPTFFFACEKYYGPEEKLKELIDSCHSNGIAVIMDIVFNHAFQPNPWLRLYYDKAKDEPTSQSPWFNVEPTHPFNVGYDFNHSSPLVHKMIDSVLNYWTSEFRFDGYRFDLSKGFTQNYTLGNVGLWSSYDQDRINNIKRISSNFWSNFPGRYVILEHFADNNEEIELSNHGCMLWGKAHNQYNEATMGYVGNGSDNFEYQVSKNERGWSFHNLVGFMESHDEERLMYNNLLYGNSTIGYDIKNVENSLQRMGLAAAFFFTVPGPKMMWQFGELGYDFSINFPSNTEESRTSPKPVKWDYKTDFFRHKLFLEYSALINLKISNPEFRTSNYRMETWGTQKQIYIDDPNLNVVVIGNFNLIYDNVYTGFQHTGLWYDYMSGDSINVTDVNMSIGLDPGDWKIFTDRPLPTPDLNNPIDTSIISSTLNLEEINKILVFPNPSSNNIFFKMRNTGNYSVEIFNSLGDLVFDDLFESQKTFTYQWDGLCNDGYKISSGIYTYIIRSKDDFNTGKISYIE